MNFVDKTQMVRNAKVFLYILLLSLIALISGFFYFYFVMLQKYSSQRCSDRFDSIVAITGGNGRIIEGFKLMSQNQGNLLLISGIDPKTKKKEIISGIPHYKFDKKKLILGYIATNTELNAYETKLFMSINSLESMILITNVSHMPRTAMLFRFAMPDKKICLHSVSKEETLYSLLTEYLKYVCAYTIHHINFLDQIYNEYLKSKFL